MTPVEIAYYPLIIWVPLFALLCSPLHPIGKKLAGVILDGPIGRSGLWTVWVVCFVLCIACVKAAVDQPFRTNYREGALSLALNLVLILAIQNLYKVICQRDKMTADRDVMKRQAAQVAEFSKNLLKEDTKEDETKKLTEKESAMPVAEEKEDSEMRKRK